jgi:hypothetical protein
MPISAAISGCSLSILLIIFAVAAAFACSQMPSPCGPAFQEWLSGGDRRRRR